jgi:hypothetical protein
MKALMVRTDFSLGESALKASRVARPRKSWVTQPLLAPTQ